MTETYCGKICAQCEQKEQMQCPGCKTGPGRLYGGDCEIAKCVRSKGHEACDTCGFQGNCGTLRFRVRMPEDRRRKLEAQKKQQAELAARAPVLGKWLWLLFWMVIPVNVASLMTESNVVQLLPGLYIPGMVLTLVCAVAQSVFLLMLGNQENGYRTAGICYLVVGTLNTVTSLLGGTEEPAGWTLLLSLPVAVVGLVAQYQEMMSHAAVLTGVDDVLSGKWRNLWKWRLGSILGIFGGVVLTLIFSAISPVLAILGLIAFLAVCVAILVISILKLVYLYRTARIFRNYEALKDTVYEN